MRNRISSIIAMVAYAALASPAAADESGDAPEIPAGARIGSVTIDARNIFDPDDPRESNAFYRFFNRFHIITRDSTIEQQLLFSEGETFDARLMEETERILRGNKYLFDAEIASKLNADGEVDVTVTTRDVWTLTPELSISRSGGENKTIIGLEESNLLGLGQRILVTRTDDVDRTSNSFEYSDRQIAGTWVRGLFFYSDNSDGDSVFVDVTKPFHALDARGAGGISLLDDDRREALYNLGDEVAEYRQERERYSAFGGWSPGLSNNWVRRLTAGFVYDDFRFSEAANPTLPQAIPEDRKLVFPFVGFEILEDDFEKTSNSDQIERNEDFYLGTRLSATLGWSDESFDADRNALIYSLSGNYGLGSLEKKALLLTLNASGRQEGSDTANATTTLNARYYSRQSEKRLFFMLLDATVGHNLDLDNPLEIGGDTGLRGYPLRYQSGDSRFLFTIEQRYFTDWYPFRLFRVGGAIFADTGRVWGDDPLGGPNLGWLTDVGVGLRFAPTRLGTRKVIHLDIAFPLDGDPTIDSVQILFEAKRSF